MRAGSQPMGPAAGTVAPAGPTTGPPKKIRRIIAHQTQLLLVVNKHGVHVRNRKVIQGEAMNQLLPGSAL